MQCLVAIQCVTIQCILIVCVTELCVAVLCVAELCVLVRAVRPDLPSYAAGTKGIFPWCISTGNFCVHCSKNFSTTCSVNLRVEQILVCRGFLCREVGTLACLTYCCTENQCSKKKYFHQLGPTGPSWS